MTQELFIIEINRLIDAIVSLKTSTDIFKDYVYPVLTSLSTTLLGFMVAIFTIKYQNHIEKEKEKAKIINTISLLALEARSNFITIKRNYSNSVSSNPFQRLMNVNHIPINDSRIDVEASHLALISNQTTFSGGYWEQTPRIKAMFNNYNYIVKLWLERNKAIDGILCHLDGLSDGKKWEVLHFPLKTCKLTFLIENFILL
ncbi:hypothetical protein LZS97_00215 [Vibrio fluvialis]|uniref:hypothetical protein n=1 Tax=Vibrio fluvialis TaxID=676 RepID=UPI001F3F7EB9|nr:hypothetical protein [Vibrio fluvialis]MCE7608561.1 hypothetical protein [Vibrio fluvialis]MCE7620154.1 hypothetical protein [Vibrio fluvialis]MCE7628353.1 hypothetical protein [Vibrio fluvialis]